MQFNKVRLITILVLIGLATGWGESETTEERTDFHRAANGAVYQNDQLIVRLAGSTAFAVLQDFCRERGWTLNSNNTPLETSSGWTRITFPAPFTADQAVTALNNADFEVEIRRNYILGDQPHPQRYPLDRWHSLGIASDWCTLRLGYHRRQPRDCRRGLGYWHRYQSSRLSQQYLVQPSRNPQQRAGMTTATDSSMIRMAMTSWPRMLHRLMKAMPVTVPRLRVSLARLGIMVEESQASRGRSSSCRCGSWGRRQGYPL